jgi:hypothetical protein
LAQLIEQARVLDRDDGLTGEVCDQLDLLLVPIGDMAAVCRRIGKLNHLCQTNKGYIRAFDSCSAHHALRDCTDDGTRPTRPAE